jgi:N-acetylmuramoyl-L-alanine amidase
VLIVPGHEPGYGGAEYANLFERDMVVDLAEQLRKFIAGNDKYEVFVTRDKDKWSPIFSDYFDKNWTDIADWTKNNIEEVNRLSRIGEFHPAVPKVLHNSAPKNVAYRLYGMSKWSNENDMDIIIHIHFNDHPGHPINSPGLYTGFAIYVPEKGYYNSTTTRLIADSILKRLKKYNPVSDFSGEKDGIIETQDLIAIGAYNSLNAPSLLIEYGYIYEPQFNNPEIYDMAIKDLAFQTYLGLQDFFDDKSPANLAGRFDTLMMPYAWTTNIKEGKNNPRDVYSLQTALIFEGVYPPSDKSLNDCPRTGMYGNCTKSAVELFQKNRGVIGESGTVGDKTLRELNSSYSFSLI